MGPYTEVTKEKLLSLRQNLKAQYHEFRVKDLKLDMSRGKPCVEQLNLSMGMMDVLGSTSDPTYEDGTDCHNYGALTGTDGTKVLLTDMMKVNPSTIIIHGNSSLDVMYDAVSRAMTHGIMGCMPWYKLDRVKFLYPVPGYDRHFTIIEYFGTEMINVSMSEKGPGMDMVEELMASDDSIKGIWCVLKYSNPRGYSYSDETVRHFAKLEPAMSDFRIFWDNAYDVHHLYGHNRDHLIEILTECKRAGSPDLVYKFASTPKTSFPGSSIAAIATSHSNLEDIKAQLENQTVGHDKVNQLHHARFFEDIHGMVEHMRRHADTIRPKFEVVEEILDRELEGLGIGRWAKPRDGYLISFGSPDDCTKDIVTRCKKVGAVMTSVGITYPYGKDPHGSNIRITPTYPTLGDLITAAKLFILCVKLSSVEKLLKTMA